MSTTTHTAIVNQWETVLDALTPTIKETVVFRRGPRQYDLRDWAEGTNTSAVSRKWQIQRQGREVLPFYHPEQREVQQEFLLTVAYYPPSFRGSQGNDDTEDAIAADSNIIYDALFSPDNYLSGQCMTQIEIMTPERGLETDTWFQDFRIVTTYYEAQTL